VNVLRLYLIKCLCAYLFALVFGSYELFAEPVSESKIQSSQLLMTSDHAILTEADIRFGLKKYRPYNFEGQLIGIVPWFCMPSASIKIWCIADNPPDKQSGGLAALRFNHDGKDHIFLTQHAYGHQYCMDTLHVFRRILKSKTVCIAGKEIDRKNAKARFWSLERIKSSTHDICSENLPYEPGCPYLD